MEIEDPHSNVIFTTFFNSENKYLNFINNILINFARLHKQVKSYIPYPYDLLVFILLGYLIAKILSLFKGSSKFKKILFIYIIIKHLFHLLFPNLESIKISAQDDSEFTINQIEKRFRELSTVLLKNSEGNLLKSGINQGNQGQAQINNPSLSQEEKILIQRQIDQAMQKLGFIKDLMNSEMNSCNKTLEEIVETQINIINNLQ